MEKKIEAIDKIIKRMVEISDSRLCKQLNANWVMLRNSLLTPPADVQERAKEMDVVAMEAIYDAFANWYHDDGSYDTFLRSEAWKSIVALSKNLAGASSLQAENERLREALEKIGNLKRHELDLGESWYNRLTDATSTAKQALTKQ